VPTTPKRPVLRLKRNSPPKVRGRVDGRSSAASKLLDSTHVVRWEFAATEATSIEGASGAETDMLEGHYERIS